MIKNKSGVWGELYTARYLRDRGYDILSSNFVSRNGEIDIVAMKNGVLCFVEVKTRNEKAILRPADSVTSEKRKRIISAARNYLAYSKLQCETRYDISEVILDDNDNLVSLNYIDGAFVAKRL